MQSYHNASRMNAGIMQNITFSSCHESYADHFATNS